MSTLVPVMAKVALVGANGFPAAAYAPTLAALRARGLSAAGHDCFQAILPSVRAGRCVHPA